MAKIKIKGYYELIDVANERAKEIKRDLKTIKKDVLLDLGTVSIKAGDITAIILEDEVRPDAWKERYYKFNENKHRILGSNIEFRIKHAISAYKTLYYACTNEKPALELISKVEEETGKFLESNPKRLYPDLEIWKPFIQPYSIRVGIINLKVIESIVKTFTNDINDSMYQEDEQLNQKIETEARAIVKTEEDVDFTIPW